MALASSRPESLHQLLPFLRQQGFDSELHGLDLLSPEAVMPWGGCFFRILPLAVGLCGGSPLGLRHFRSSVRFTPSQPQPR